MGVLWCVDDVLMFTMSVGRSVFTLHQFELDQIGNGVPLVAETPLPTLDYPHALQLCQYSDCNQEKREWDASKEYIKRGLLVVGQHRGGGVLNIAMQGYNIERTENLTVCVPDHHKHTIVWIHGLNQHRQYHLNSLMQALHGHIACTKIIAPKAPQRYVTCMKTQASSWFDIKQRSEKSFLVPFDESFSTAEVIDSYETILRPIVEEESKRTKETGGKLIVCGFSQGCGMSLHCLYSLPHLIDATIGISGYLFPFTPFDGKLDRPVHIIYGLADDLRPWQYTKVVYQGKIPQEKITLIEGMKHSIDQNTIQALSKELHQILP